jgi:hypothetical protein
VLGGYEAKVRTKLIPTNSLAKNWVDIINGGTWVDNWSSRYYECGENMFINN